MKSPYPIGFWINGLGIKVDEKKLFPPRKAAKEVTVYNLEREREREPHQ